MRKSLPIILHLLLLVPVLAGAAQADEGGGSYSLLGSFVQMLGALAVVVGLILLFYYVSNRWLKAGPVPGGLPRYIRLVESRYLAPKKSLLLVEVGGEYLLLSSSGDGMQFIKQVDMLEEIEVLDSKGVARLFPGELHERLSGFMTRPMELLRTIPRTKKNGVQS